MLTASGAISSRASVIRLGRLAKRRDAFMKRRSPPAIGPRAKPRSLGFRSRFRANRAARRIPWISGAARAFPSPFLRRTAEIDIVRSAREDPYFLHGRKRLGRSDETGRRSARGR